MFYKYCKEHPLDMALSTKEKNLLVIGHSQGKKEVMDKIRHILDEYFNGTDLLHGSDECYVIARIADLVEYDYENIKNSEGKE